MYLPRLKDTHVLVASIQDGLSLLTWEQDSFAYAESYDEAAGRYRGLRGGTQITVSPDSMDGLLVKSEVALQQMDGEADPEPDPTSEGPPGQPPTPPSLPGGGTPGETTPEPAPVLRRFHGTVTLDSTRTGRDAGQVADEVIAHLVGLVGAQVTVTLEIDARLPDGAPDNVVRTVTENSRTLKFTSQGFEED